LIQLRLRHAADAEAITPIDAAAAAAADYFYAISCHQLRLPPAPVAITPHTPLRCYAIDYAAIAFRYYAADAVEAAAADASCCYADVDIYFTPRRADAMKATLHTLRAAAIRHYITPLMIRHLRHAAPDATLISSRRHTP